MVRTRKIEIEERYCDFCYGDLEHPGLAPLKTNKSGNFAVYRVTVEETSGEEKFVIEGNICPKCYDWLKERKETRKRLERSFKNGD